jgi:recombination protein RecT
MSEDKALEVQQKALRPIDKLKVTLSETSVKEQFANALKESAPLFAASILDLYMGDPQLQKCDPNLVVIEALKAAVLRLPINKSLGFAYIVAYQKNSKVGNEWIKEYIPTFQLGYKGMIQLANRTGYYKYIHCGYIYQGETVEENWLNGELTKSGTKTSDEVTGYFAHFETINGLRKTIYRSKDEAEKHAGKYSAGYKANLDIWKKETDKMHRKGVLRDLLSKWGMLSVEICNAVADDIKADSVFDDEPVTKISIATLKAAAEVADSQAPEPSPQPEPPSTHAPSIYRTKELPPVQPSPTIDQQQPRTRLSLFN